MGKGIDAFVATWKTGDVEIRQELFPYGGEFTTTAAWAY